jgi:hypothetical protein
MSTALISPISIFRASGLALTVGLLLTATPAHSAILFYNVFKTQAYSQTSNAQPVTPTGFGGFANVNASLATDLTGGTVTSLSPLSPMALTGSNGNFAFGVGVATKAVLDIDFPNATTYTFNLTGGTFGGQSASLATPASDEYAPSVPFFTNNLFSALQGVNSTAAINLTFNPFIAPAGVNTPLTFLLINRVSDGTIAFSDSGTNTLSSAFVAANTLLPGTQYDLSIVYSDRLLTANAGFSGATAFSAYDLRTDLFFTTAAAATATPEPSSLLLAAAGMAIVAISRRRVRA